MAALKVDLSLTVQLTEKLVVMSEVYSLLQKAEGLVASREASGGDGAGVVLLQINLASN